MNETTRNRPIFIHAMWRTGSTYVWNKFREAGRYRAYCEPLHELLWMARREDFEKENLAEINRNLRHPKLSSHYFDEFPVGEDGRVPLSMEELTFDTYCLEPEEDQPNLAAYIQNLLAFAEQRNQIPVLQFNRSLFRSAWLSARFSPVNILLYRHPFDTWKSFALSEYFAAGVCRIVGQHRQWPYLRPIAERWKVPYVEGTYEERAAFYRSFFQERGDRLYPMFFSVFMASILHNLTHADVILDLNALSDSEEARHEAGERLRSFGIELSFEDCSIARYDSGPEERKARQRGEQAVLDYFRIAAQPRRSELEIAHLRNRGALSAGLNAYLHAMLGD